MSIYDVTNGGKIVIKANAKLDMDENCLANNTAANFIIEDGGQLITSSAVAATVEKNIEGFGSVNSVKTGWNFIASPLSSA